MRLRLYAWYAVCAALLAGHVAWLVALRAFSHAEAAVLTGHLVLGGLVLAMAALILTTPPDAVRFPRRRSERLIMIGSVALQLAAALLAPLHARDAAAVGGAALVVLAGVIVVLRAARSGGFSAWTAALVGWNPLVVYDSAVSGRALWAAVAAGGIAAALLVWGRLSRRSATRG